MVWWTFFEMVKQTSRYAYQVILVSIFGNNFKENVLDCGKSSLLTQLLYKKYADYTETTLGALFNTYIQKRNAYKYNFNIWDTVI